MTGKSLGVTACILVCMAAGYGFGSGWIRVGHSEAVRPSTSREQDPAQASPASLDPAVVRAVAQTPTAKTNPPAAPSPTSGTTTAGTTAPSPPTPGPAVPASTAVVDPSAPKPAGNVDRANFQILPNDVMTSLTDAAKQPVLIQSGGLVDSDGPELSLMVSVGRIGQGVGLPAGAANATLSLTMTLTKPGESSFTPAKSAFTFPASLTLSPGTDPTYASLNDSLLLPKTDPGVAGPFAFAIKESGTYVLTVTKTCLGVTVESTRVLTFRPLNHYPPTIDDVAQMIDGKPVTYTDLTAQVALAQAPPFLVDVTSTGGRNVLIVDPSGKIQGTATADGTSGKGKATLKPVVPMIDQPLSLFAVDQWSLDRSGTISVYVPSAPPTAATIPAAKKSDFVPFTEFGRRRRNPNGFNPADKVETRVARLYFFRDALKVAKIINRDVEVRNRKEVDTRRRQADETRRQADDFTDNRRLQDEKAIRAAQDSRAAERKLKQAQAAVGQSLDTANAIAATNDQVAGIDAQVAGLQAQATKTNQDLAAAQSSLKAQGTAPQDPAGAEDARKFIASTQAVLDRNQQAQDSLTARKKQILADAGSRAATGPTAAGAAPPVDASVLITKSDTERKNASAALDAAASDVQAKRQVEADQSDQLLGLQLHEERAREQQFRDEVAASTADADIYAAGVPSSDDPVQQVSVSVIGDSLIQLRGPIKGVNIIRMMINEIDSPAGQVRVGIHTVQINGEHQDRMEVVADRIRHYVDHSRFLTMQSAQMLRKAVVLVASRKAQEASLELPDGPADQQQRDLLYIEAFFGRDFLKELCDIDSEFLKTGNKLLSLHSMDSTSLASALFLIALAKNETRQEILETFDAMLRDQLPAAEMNYTLAAGPPPKGKGSKHKGLLQLSENAKFQSFRGLFDAEVEGNDTLAPIQREFIRLAQIFKSRLVVELEYNQRLQERGLIEDRAGDYERDLLDAKRREDDAKARLRELKVRIFEQQSQVLGLLDTFNSSLKSFQDSLQKADVITTEFNQQLVDAFRLAAAADPIVADQLVKYGDSDPLNVLNKNRNLLDLIKIGSFSYSFRDADGSKVHTYGFQNNPADPHDPLVIPIDNQAGVSLVDILNRRYTAMQNIVDQIERINLLPIQKVQLSGLKQSLQTLQKQANTGPYSLFGTVAPIYFFYRDVKPLLVDASRRLRDLNQSANVLSGEVGDFLDSNQNNRRIYQDWNAVLDKYYSTFAVDSVRINQTLDKVRRVDDALSSSLQLDQKYRFAIQAAQEDRRPIDHKKLLDMLIDEIEEKYIELLEGTRSHVANVDGYIKSLATALDDDLNTQFYLPAFREIRSASAMWDVTLGQVETTTILTNNRMFAKVDPAATMEFDLPKRDILINEAMNGAKAIYDDFGALVNDPSFLALTKLKSGQPTGSLSQGRGGGTNTVRNILPGLPRSGDEQLLSQNGSGRREFGSAMEALIPDPAVYKFETGTGFEISPVIQPDGQSVVFDFNYMYTTNVREPVRADEKHLGRVKRQFVHTPVQLSNYELREVSKYTVALKASRTSRGVPLFEDIPGLGVLFRPLPSADSSLQQNIILAQSTIFPTLFDLMGLRWASAVADLDTLRLRNDEFVVRRRHQDVENRVFDISSTVVDDALRTAPGQRRADLYRSQESIPQVHPNGYKGPGRGLRDSQLREGYDPIRNNPTERFVPGESREVLRGAPSMQPEAPMAPSESYIPGEVRGALDRGAMMGSVPADDPQLLPPASGPPPFAPSRGDLHPPAGRERGQGVPRLAPLSGDGSVSPSSYRVPPARAAAVCQTPTRPPQPKDSTSPQPAAPRRPAAALPQPARPSAVLSTLPPLPTAASPAPPSAATTPVDRADPKPSASTNSPRPRRGLSRFFGKD